ncbi:SUN domain-containing protein 2-like isoform X2 [Bacillus rossius redtenbacheri]|uniref:SUN domain-containing protein 2-like isoform X2 n=1 Tax=Bacillus rossius redtenbacheri TaxID=93214 RepID=UPI002FDDAB1D
MREKHVVSKGCGAGDAFSSSGDCSCRSHHRWTVASEREVGRLAEPRELDWRSKSEWSLAELTKSQRSADVQPTNRGGAEPCSTPLRRCQQHRAPTRTSTCQVNGPDISFTPRRASSRAMDQTLPIVCDARRRGIVPQPSGVAAKSGPPVQHSLLPSKDPARAGCGATLSCRQVLPWLFFVLLCSTAAVALWSTATRSQPDVSLQLSHMEGVVSDLTAKNKELASQYSALQRAMSSFQLLQNNIHNVCALSSVQDLMVSKAVERRLAVYDADKIGLADFALESAGGAVVETPDTFTYYSDSWLELFGLPLFRYGPCSSPRCILQPSVQPGHCWAFRGARGSVKIRLARRVRVTGVTLDHIPPSIALSGDVSSAPKSFLVAALVPGPGKRLAAHALGVFQYNISGEPRQSFRIQNAEFAGATRMVQLSVLENHGHPAYTCIYRFRVHGQEPAA